MGGGDGIGVGSGNDWGVGPGGRGGCCGGDRGGSGWDTDPVPIYQPPNPVYPPGQEKNDRGGDPAGAREGGRLDRSIFEVASHCVDTALANAVVALKPARRSAGPSAFGIITVTFDILTGPGRVPLRPFFPPLLALAFRSGRVI
jgi:hypothetical protein